MCPLEDVLNHLDMAFQFGANEVFKTPITKKYVIVMATSK